MEKRIFPVVDIIIQKNDEIVLIKRLAEPFKGKFAIPGGGINHGERAEDAAIREAQEETSLKIKLIDILGIYSDPKRDPRCHSINTVFIAQPISGELKAGSDAGEAKWFNMNDINTAGMPFDHGKIIEDYKKWREKKGTYWSGR